EDTHGAVYEMLEADTLAQYIMDHPDEVEVVAEKAAKLLKEMHQKELPFGFLKPAKNTLQDWLNDAKPYLSSDEISSLSDIINNFKDTNTFLHLDFHTKNVMVREGELVIIDLDDACVGDPLIDIACLMMSMCNDTWGDEECLHFVGMTKSLKDSYIKKFLETYFDTTNEAQIDSVLAKLRPINGLRTIHARVNRLGMSEEARKAKIDEAVVYIRDALKNA
ncbi:MAG: aminoglycoside phosphotransferase family protein, partial [Bacillota bacterium]|nr:aminoglycoside phosphotransferase family protein [Bacillota bacterium]